MLPSEAVQLAGAATPPSDHDMPLAPPLQNTATEIAATAMKLLSVSAAIKVATAMPSSPHMIGILRLLTGLSPILVSQSVIAPKPTLPTTPKKNGIEATRPVARMLM